MNTPYDIRLLKEEDLDALYDIRRISFQDNSDPLDPVIRASHLSTFQYKFGCFLDGALAASASWYPFDAYLYGEEVEIGGLASVVSALEHRRKGCVKALLRDGLERLRDAKIGWNIEFPFDTRYYARFGWDTIQNGLIFKVPTERFHAPHRRSALTRVTSSASTGRELLSPIHRTYASRYNFMHARSEKIRPIWKHLIEGPPWRPSKHTIIFASEEAYLIFTLGVEDGQEVAHVEDWAHTTPAGRRDIFATLGALYGQVATISIQLPSDDPLVMEWSNFLTPHPHPLHARIVDVERALEMVRPEEPVSLGLSVTDDFCPWNQGDFALTAHEQGASVTRKTPEQAVTLDIKALARILSGSLSVDAAHRAGLVGGEASALRSLSRLATHPSHLPMADYF